MRLVRLSRETHGNHRHSREKLVTLPRVERQSRQNFVLADGDIRTKTARYDERIIKPDRVLRLHAKRRKKTGEMVGKETVASNAKRTQTQILIFHDEAS